MIAEEHQAEATLREFERALSAGESARYDLTLFVSGDSLISARAVSAVRALCDAHLPDRYDLQVVDVHKNLDLVKSRGVVAAPTLIKDHPLPRRVLVGDLSDAKRLLSALDIELVDEVRDDRGAP